MFSHAEKPLLFHTDSMFDRENTVQPLYNGHLGDREKWPLLRAGRYGELGLSCDKFLLESTDKFMLTASHNVNPVINNIQRDKIHKKLECFKSKY